MIILPVFGHILFFTFGRRYSLRKTHKEYLEKDNFKYEDLSSTPIINKDVKYLFEQQRQIGKRGIYKGDYKIYQNRSVAYKALFSDLRKAKKFIHFEMYILHQVEIYDEFNEIIVSEANDGVSARFMHDCFEK